METFGSGGEDPWGGQHEKVLDFRRDEEDANVVWKLFSNHILDRSTG
jgi:hypothetical protein